MTDRGADREGAFGDIDGRDFFPIHCDSKFGEFRHHRIHLADDRATDMESGVIEVDHGPLYAPIE